MQHARLTGSHLTRNTIFDAKNQANRDNCLAPFICLRERFLENGISLDTPDIPCQERPLFDLSMNVREVNPNIPTYVLILETPFIHPENADMKLLSRYRKVFTWDDTLVDGKHFIKLNYANPEHEPVVNGFAGREHLCCLIAGNKKIKVPDPRELYSERVRAIRWFENNAPGDFDLYGIGWELPPATEKRISKRWRKLYSHWVKFTDRKPFPSYRGMVAHKREVLEKNRFCICYENIRDVPGYITEKIFDCFFSGCVPVYWGANNITDYVPSGCFIDRRNFADTAVVYQFLQSMTEQDYMGYQKQIAEFLQGEFKRQFSADYFADVIVRNILDDLAVKS